MSDRLGWPQLPYRDWKPTKQTLHRYAQIVGKVRMALVPFRNHWWHVTLYVSARGLTTGPLPCGELTGEVEFDFISHRLRVRTSRGREASFALRQGLACAQFYGDLFAALSELGIDVAIQPRPFDLRDSPAFPNDTINDSYDADAVARWWTILRLTDQVLGHFASGFSGKASPTQLFWHGFDLAHSRYSGRRAPAIEGADRVTAEAYSHEVIAFGWWPGDDRGRPIRRSTPTPRRSRRACATKHCGRRPLTGRTPEAAHLRCCPTTCFGQRRTRLRRCSLSTRARTCGRHDGGLGPRVPRREGAARAPRGHVVRLALPACCEGRRGEPGPKPAAIRAERSVAMGGDSVRGQDGESRRLSLLCLRSFVNGISRPVPLSREAVA
jgi:hypothetical protein